MAAPLHVIDIIVPSNGADIPREIRRRLFVNRALGAIPDTIVMPGLGQGGWVPRHITRQTAGIAVADPLPHEAVSAAALPTLGVAYPRAVIAAWHRAYGSHTSQLPHVVVESQAAIGTVLAEAAQPSQIGSLALLRPGGLNSHHFGTTDADILRTFTSRIIATLLQPDQSPLASPWNIYLAYQLALRLDPKTRQQAAVGLRHNTAPALATVATERHRRGHKTAIFAGEHDAVFPAAELRAAWEALAHQHLDFSILTGATHRSLVTPRGRQDLATALEYVRSNTRAW